MSAAPSLSYATGNTPRPTGRRFVICLRITAAVLMLLAILVSWNTFSYFGVTHRARGGPAWMGSRPAIITLEMKWAELAKAIPVFVILTGFAVAYLFLARRANRGSETGIFAAGVMSMIMTLVAALWLLTLFVYGAINVEDAKLWWEHVLSIMMIGMSIAVIPWLAYVTILGFDQMRRPRLRPVEETPQPPAPPDATTNQDAV